MTIFSYMYICLDIYTSHKHRLKFDNLIVIIMFFAGIGIVFNVAGCLIRGRRRWSVTYTSPRGTTYFRIFYSWEGHLVTSFCKFA